MKGFTKVMLIIASVAIGILFIVVASVAWFTSNPEVDANDVSLSSAKTLVVAFDSSLYKSHYSYDGQDGVTETFVYPYGYFKVNLSNSSTEKNSVVKLDFSTVRIECPSLIDEVPNMPIPIEQLFRVQISCYQESAGGGYDMESQDSSDPYYNVFVEADPGEGSYTLVADDYYLGENNYLYREYDDQRVEFPQGVYYFAFTYVFCPESGGGYARDNEGEYIGQIAYQGVGGGTTYTYSAGSYVQSDSGEYTQVLSGYEQASNIAYKYTKVAENNYVEDNVNGTYIKIKDHNGNELVGNNDNNNFAEIEYYSYVEGFPYSDIRYQGAKYSFSIVCSVEEV